MVNVSIARRYARALFEVAQDKADQVLEQLMALGCTLAQGFYFAPPVEAADVPEVMARIAARLGREEADRSTSV